MTTEINLEIFCATDRPKLARPFSIGAWTYATNGHILVRVPRRDDVAENPDAPNASLVYEKVKSPRRYKQVPQFELSGPFEWEEERECWRCRYHKGKIHDCPDCKCACPECGGTGKLTDRNFKKTQIGRVGYNSKYISWLQSLPGVEIGPPHKKDPLAFRFDGGEGLLMPLGIWEEPSSRSMAQAERKPKRAGKGKPTWT